MGTSPGPEAQQGVILAAGTRAHDALLDQVLGGPEDRRTLPESVAKRLRELIIEGHLPPGTPLRLQPLARRLGVSVMPVREALRALEAERLVAFSPHRGATVLQVSSEEIEEIYAMRAALERLAARIAMERITPEAVTALREQLGVMAAAAAAEDLERFSEEDRHFHRMLYAAAERQSLYARILDLSQSSLRATNLAYGIWRPLMLGLEAHRPILDAIEAGDPELVARLTFEHVTEGGARIYAAVRDWEERQRIQSVSEPPKRHPARSFQLPRDHHRCDARPSGGWR